MINGMQNEIQNKKIIQDDDKWRYSYSVCCMCGEPAVFDPDLKPDSEPLCEDCTASEGREPLMCCECGEIEEIKNDE